MTERPTADYDAPPNLYAPDGYRYGVMFNDGSVAEPWTGRTQRERASEAAEQWAAEYAPDNITLARHRRGEPWTRVLSPGRGSDG